MKKRTILYSMLFAVGTVFTGCSDQFLEDMSPYDKYTADKTFEIERNLVQYIQGRRDSRRNLAVRTGTG